jgi:uncharacterized protein
MKKNYLYLIFSSFLAIAFIFFVVSLISKTGQVNSVTIRGNDFKVELASTAEKRQKGLGERERICENCGMLFIFPRSGNYHFWMKDMKFSLDIIWMADNKIVYIAKNVSPELEGTLNASLPADKVLEINAGLCDKYGIKEGDKVSIK